MKNEKEMATNFYFKMTVVKDKMADPLFSKQKDEKKMVYKGVQRQQFDMLLPCKLSCYFSKCIAPLFLVIFILLNLFKILSYYQLPNHQY